jgi:hypothetical protein
VCDEQRRQLAPAVARRQHQRGLAVAVARVHVGAGREERGERAHVVPPDRKRPFRVHAPTPRAALACAAWHGRTAQQPIEATAVDRDLHRR